MANNIEGPFGPLVRLVPALAPGLIIISLFAVCCLILYIIFNGNCHSLSAFAARGTFAFEETL